MRSSGSPPDDIRQLLDRITRRERGRLLAGLVQRLGPHQLALAEDVAQEALLSALADWQYRGIPENPTAWLSRVAHNRALDRLRRERRIRPLDDAPEPGVETIAPERIGDPELKLMFLCCRSELDGIDQLALTLRVVSGFTAREIAGLFLCSEAAMGQRLARCKRRLAGHNGASTEPLTAFDITRHREAVLKVIYLMFSLGYAPRQGDVLIRRDVADEALRLALELAQQPQTASPDTLALAALLCFQASRFDSREDAEGLPALLKDQDRSCWNGELIQAGFEYLRQSSGAERVSRYHLEAGIASLYAAAPGWEHIDWPALLRQYRQLERMVDSPVVSISAAVAEAFAGEPERALAKLDALAADATLASYAPFHIARAEVLKLLGRDTEARGHFQAAIDAGSAAPVVQHLQQRLAGAL
jgi:RNA polymerase sigma-70 factor (ECF subfamily)